MPTSSNRTVFHYSPEANWFVGDAEPYGFAVSLCVFKLENAPALPTTNIFSFLSGRPRRVAPTVFPLISDVFRNAEDGVPYEKSLYINI